MANDANKNNWKNSPTAFAEGSREQVALRTLAIAVGSKTFKPWPKLLPSAGCAGAPCLGANTSALALSALSTTYYIKILSCRFTMLPQYVPALHHTKVVLQS